MVTPAWPPTTGMETASGGAPMASATKVFARSTSSLVTPSSLRGSYVPALERQDCYMGFSGSRVF